jgi:hypothetical protein
MARNDNMDENFAEIRLSFVMLQASCFIICLYFVQCRYEKLHRWDEALRAYTMKSSQASGPLQNLDATLGRAITSFLLRSTLHLQSLSLTNHEKYFP